MPPFALEGHCLLLLKVVDRNVDRNLALLLQVGLVIELQDLAQVVHVRVYVLTVWYFVQRLGSRNLGELQAENRSFAQSVGKLDLVPVGTKVQYYLLYSPTGMKPVGYSGRI